MNIFQKVKERVTARQVAEKYECFVIVFEEASKREFAKVIASLQEQL